MTWTCLIQTHTHTTQNTAASSAYQGNQPLIAFSLPKYIAVCQFTDHLLWLGDAAVWTHAQNSLLVNWGVVLCLTELKFRSLCLISETKGSHSPIQKEMKPQTVLGFRFVDIFIQRALFNVLQRKGLQVAVVFQQLTSIEVFEEHLKFVFFVCIL